MTACIGANGSGDGGLIIAGTGTAGIARIAGAARIVGGRGFLLGDDGSGARIGADAVRAALRAFDGLEPMSGLSRDLLAKFDSDPLRMTEWAQTAKPGDYGAFAPRVFEAARAGESGALEIVGRAARAIVAIFRALEALGAERIAIVGGVAEPLRTYLPTEVEARLRRPKHDAVDGAILLVGGALPAPGDRSMTIDRNVAERRQTLSRRRRDAAARDRSAGDSPSRSCCPASGRCANCWRSRAPPCARRSPNWSPRACCSIATAPAPSFIARRRASISPRRA